MYAKIAPELTFGTGTADFCKFMDSTFDSVNSYTEEYNPKKPLRTLVKPTSGHLEFWTEAAQIFKSVRFYCNKKKIFVKPPTVKNWSDTLSRFVYLHKYLFSFKYQFITPRVFNQDALENFFGCIRSHAIRSTKPNACNFVSSFKSVVINKMSNYHSNNFNCENEGSSGNPLEFLCNMVSERASNSGRRPQLQKDEAELTDIAIPDNIPIVNTRVAKNIQVYLSGYISKRLRKGLTCKSCLRNIVTKNDIENSELLLSREVRKGILTRPNPNFNYLVGRCIALVSYLLPQVCYKKNVTIILIDCLKKNLPTKIINCRDHNLDERFLTILTDFLLYHYCNTVNKILRGKSVKVLRCTSDPIQISAHNLYLKHKKK